MAKRNSLSQLLDGRPQRIGLIKPSALGDVVQTLPLLPVLRERFGHARISWVINGELSELLQGHPNLDELIAFPRHGSWREWIQWMRRLRRHRFDLVFDLQGLLRTGLMTWATGAGARIGLESAREGAHLAYHAMVPDTSRDVPAHHRYWRLAEILGLGGLRREAIIPLREQHRHWAAEKLKTLHGPVLAVHPGARWPTKRWPAEKFAAVTAKAVRTYGASTVLLGSQGERALADQLATMLRRFVPSARIRNLAGQTGLKQLAALLEQSESLLTNDSGPMHLAAALGTPVVAVFTCTSPIRSGPPGCQHELVETRLSCAASYKKRCPYSGDRHLACLEELSTERVWQALVRAIQKNGLVPHAA